MKTFTQMIYSLRRFLSTHKTTYDNEIKQWLNDAQDKISKKVVVDDLIRKGQFYTLDELSSDTVTLSISQDASAFTLSAGLTGLDAAYNSAKIAVGDEVLRIKDVTSTSGGNLWHTMKDSAISTESSYYIYQDEYVLPYYVQSVLEMWKTAPNEVRFDLEPYSRLLQRDVNRDTYDEPERVAYYGGNTYPVITSGMKSSTIACTSGNSKFTVTGDTPDSVHAGESIEVEGVPELFKITSINGQDYNVDRTVNYTVSGNAYQVRPEGLTTIVFNERPDDVYLIHYAYLKKPQKLVSDDDISELPEEFHDLIVERAKIIAMEENGQNADRKYIKWERDLQDLAGEKPVRVKRKIQSMFDNELSGNIRVKPGDNYNEVVF